jgi:hypothetical protein
MTEPLCGCAGGQGGIQHMCGTSVQRGNVSSVVVLEVEANGDPMGQEVSCRPGYPSGAISRQIDPGACDARPLCLPDDERSLTQFACQRDLHTYVAGLYSNTGIAHTGDIYGSNGLLQDDGLMDHKSGSKRYWHVLIERGPLPAMVLKRV